MFRIKINKDDMFFLYSKNVDEKIIIPHREIVKVRKKIIFMFTMASYKQAFILGLKLQ